MGEKMESIQVADIGRYEGREVELRGWLYNKRSSGKLHFLQLRDGSGVVQCVVFKGDVAPELFECCAHLPQESSIAVRGQVRREARAPIGYEMGVSHLDVVQEAEPYPIAPKEHGVSFLLDHRHLWLRSSRPRAILKIRSEICQACRDFMAEHRFVLVDAPIFTPAACEGTSTLFETEYFGDTAYLTQSGQLYMEAAAMALGKVYCFGPTFRAEKSKTRRHLTEFWMIEPEMAYCDLAGAMDLAEDLVLYVLDRALDRCREELKVLDRDTAKLEQVRRPFPRITYDEAVERLTALGSDIVWGRDLGGDDETVLASDFESPVFVHRYPRAVKAFYMKEDAQDRRLALCMDLLASEGYGEIIGGGQREDDLAVLQHKIATHQLPPEAFRWYLDLRRYGSVAHAGFGMGIERVIAWVCGLKHVREAVPFPRTMQRLYP